MRAQGRPARRPDGQRSAAAPDATEAELQVLRPAAAGQAAGDPAAGTATTEDAAPGAQTVAAMGVPRLVLLNSYRVEKSFWQTPFLEPAAIREQLILGLEQARDTVLPEVIIENASSPLSRTVCRSSRQAPAGWSVIRRFPDLPTRGRGPVTLAIGPEGGWIPYEVGEIHRRRTATGAAGRTHSARGDGGQRPAGPVVLAPPGGGAALHPRRARRPTQTALR